jgi:hypothetical protein
MLDYAMIARTSGRARFGSKHDQLIEFLQTESGGHFDFHFYFEPHSAMPRVAKHD